MTPKISVIVCTRDRHETLGQAVESIAACAYPRFDVHIMDQSVNEQSRRVIEDIVREAGKRCAIHYHHLDKAGLSRAYNRGVEACDGDVIAFTDDDCTVPTDWLAQIASEFESDPQAGLLYGQVLIPAGLDEQVARGAIVPALPIPRRERLIRGGPFKVFGMGANMAVRRPLFEQTGGFDEALGGGGPLRSSQDFDFAYRTYLTGQAILLAPAVRVDHYGLRTPEQWPVTMQAYGIGDGAFYGKHIRCGDARAFRLLAQALMLAGARELKQSLRRGRWEKNIYGRNLFVGLRAGARFSVDRAQRLYRENDKAKLTVSQANVVTSVSARSSAP